MGLPGRNIYRYSYCKGRSLVCPRQNWPAMEHIWPQNHGERELQRDCLIIQVSQSIPEAHESSMSMMRDIWSCPRKPGFRRAQIWPCHMLLTGALDFSSSHFPWQLTFLQHVLSLHKMPLGNEWEYCHI